VRVAVVPGPDNGCWLSELAENGSHGPPAAHGHLPAAVAAYERSGGVRWVWGATGDIYPGLLRAGVRVERCHDVALVEGLLLGREGRPGDATSLGAAWARLSEGTDTARGPGAETQPLAAGSGTAAPPAGNRSAAAAARPGRRPPGAGQRTLFQPADPDFRTPQAAVAALADVHAGQARRIAADSHPGRLGLLAAAESAGGLTAAEMAFHGLPWRGDIHAALLTEMLGPRPVAGLRPPRLEALAAQLRAAFGGRPVNPDSPGQVLRALAADGIRLPSTRSHVLRTLDHPAVPLLLEYKELARLFTANGWAWLDEWVCAGRFRPAYVVGGVVSGRWASRGGGALQIPRVLRRAVVADPGWMLVVADAAQLEPRVLAAISGDGALAAAAGTGDLYEALAGAFGGDRGRAKIALLSAMYGGAGGEALQLLAVMRRRFPRAAQYLEAAARAGEEGRVVRSWLGRTCPPPSPAWRGLAAGPDDTAAAFGDPPAGESRAVRSVRARGRFTRNFVVQASAADWAIVLLAGLRRRLAAMSIPNGSAGVPAGSGGRSPDGAGEKTGRAEPQIVFFQHDEVIVHCPEPLAGAVTAAAGEAAREAGQLVFGPTPVRFPLSTAVVTSYADAK
jgi:DNA polymerase family A